VPREEHWNPPAVVAVGLTKVGQKVVFFKQRANANPNAPQDDEKKAIGGYIWTGPYENEHAQVQGMPYPSIWSSDDKRTGWVRIGIQIRSDWGEAKGVE
jgi:hypothetical protein